MKLEDLPVFKCDTTLNISGFDRHFANTAFSKYLRHILTVLLGWAHTGESGCSLHPSLSGSAYWTECRVSLGYSSV